MKYLIALAAFVLLATRPALEATSRANLTVTATVTANCVVTAPVALDFGTYDTSTAVGSPVDTRADALSIACTNGAPGVTIGLDQGRRYADAHRNLQSTDDATVAYDVFTSPDYSTEWNLVQTVAFSSTSTQPAAIPLYGRVLPGQKPHPGRYSDSLTAVVNF